MHSCLVGLPVARAVAVRMDETADGRPIVGAGSVWSADVLAGDDWLFPSASALRSDVGGTRHHEMWANVADRRYADEEGDDPATFSVEWLARWAVTFSMRYSGPDGRGLSLSDGEFYWRVWGRQIARNFCFLSVCIPFVRPAPRLRSLVFEDAARWFVQSFGPAFVDQGLSHWSSIEWGTATAATLRWSYDRSEKGWEISPLDWE